MTPPPPPADRNRGRAALLWATVLVVVLAIPPVAAWLLLRSESGTAWLLSRVPALQVEGLQGAVLSDRLAIDKLRWQGAAGTLEIRALALDEAQWQLWPAPGQWIGLRAKRLHADRVRWQSGAPSDTPSAPLAAPTSLQLPLQVEMPVDVQTLEIDTQPPVTDLALTLHVGADGGRAHAITGLALRWDRLRAAGGRVRIGSTAPLALDAALDLSSAEGAPLPWQAQVHVGGELEAIDLSATLRGSERAAVDLQAGLTPFKPWPLAGLNASTEGLDLASINSQWPQTRLRGKATLNSSGRDQPIEATLQFKNDAPGRWNERRVPVSHFDAVLRGRLDAPDTLELDTFDLRLADATAPAGRLQGKGRWQGETLTLDARLDGLAPQRLDGRASKMSLNGPLTLRVTGLPSLDPASSAGSPAAPVADVNLKLDGQVEGAPTSVTLALQLQAAAGRLNVPMLEARAGGARATLQLTAEQKDTNWSVQSKGELVEFDPLPWWPGPAGGAWQRGPHRLNANWSVDLNIPADAPTLPPATLMQHLRGQARLQVEQSQIAGVPVQATLALDQEKTGGAVLNGTLDLAGNHLRIDGQADAAGDGRSDRWQADLQAPALAALAPLIRLIPAAAQWAPSAGQFKGKANLSGRWPGIQMEGEAALSALKAGPLAVADARLTWKAGSSARSPLGGRFDATEIRFNDQHVPVMQAELEGNLTAHRLLAQLALPVQPPAPVAQSLGLTAEPGTRVALRAEGGWTGGLDGGRWKGQVRELGVGGWNGQLPLANAPAGGAAWLDARDLQAELSFGPGGVLQRLHADAGRLKLAGGLGLRWDEIDYDASTQRLQLQAELERFQVAPILARWQPTMGWAGDLEVGATINIQAAARFDADIVIERRSGDLRVLDAAESPMPLALTDLRLALNAHDGTWYFTQALAGKTLGELGGALRVRTAPEQRWPAPDAPLDGTLKARVANLGVWGAWVPPGWRLQGMVDTTASFGGRFGAPEVTGVLRGSGLGVRNLLLGVNVRDGEVAVRLEGEKATVDRFELRAGDGSLTIKGGATLGAEPEAALSLKAEKFQLLGRIDRKLVASGRADLQLGRELLKLDGQIGIDEGLFDTTQSNAPTLDEDVVVRRTDEPVAVAAEADTANAPRRKIEVAVGVDLGKRLRVRGRGLDTLLAGQLRLTAPAGRLAVNGTVSTVGGSYVGYGQKMKIERGLVAFYGPANNPRLDVLALREKLDIDVGVEITGTAQTPRIRLYSNPEMSDSDKLSWLVLGRDPTSLGRTDTALLQRAALALISGEGEGATDGVLRTLGIDDLSVRQSEGDVRETIVAIGKQISDRWYVGYERGVNATTGTWQLIYRAAQRFTLRLQSGLEDSLDAIWVWRVP